MLALILLAAAPVLALAQTVTVTGEADSRVKPDRAIITLGTETEAPTARQVQRDSGKATQKLIKKLKEDGIPENRIKTAAYNLFLDRERDVFISTSILEFPVDKIEDVGKILDDAVATGANAVDNVFYTLNEPEAEQEKLLAKALRRSRSKAKKLAAAAGFEIAGIKKIEEGEVVGPIIAAEGGAETSGAPSPTNPGELKITAMVKVTYKLK